MSRWRSLIRVILPGLLLTLGLVGCSAFGSKDTREVPLPEGVDPSDLFNAKPPESVQVADASPYYEKEKSTAKVIGFAANQPRYNAAQSAQIQAGEKVMTNDEAILKQRQDRLKAEEKQLKVLQMQPALEKSKQVLNTKKDLAQTSKAIGEAVKAVAPSIYNLAKDSVPEVAPSAELKKLEFELAQKLAQLEAPEVKPGARYNFLVLSGGGTFGAYTVGALSAWAECGGLPSFDVVTGVSTGALIATAIFPGPEYLHYLQRMYTTSEQKLIDFRGGSIWKTKLFPKPFGIGTDSISDNTPLRKLIEEVTNSPGYFEKVIAEHARGRRLYLGTCNLDTMRFVIWDMGAIASECTPESKKLYVDLVLTAAAIPPLMPGKLIPVRIDGQTYEEFHVDGGAARKVFFYPPSDWPGEVEDAKTDYKMLSGAKLYVMYSGKVYDDPEPMKLKLLPVIMRSTGTMLGANGRAELARLYTHSVTRGMEWRLSAIPEDCDPVIKEHQFEPEYMKRMYEEGYARFKCNTLWNDYPITRAVSEERARRGLDLTTQPSQEIGPLTPFPRTGPRRR